MNLKRSLTPEQVTRARTKHVKDNLSIVWLAHEFGVTEKTMTDVINHQGDYAPDALPPVAKRVGKTPRLSPEQADEARRLHQEEKRSIALLANDYGVSKQTMINVLTRQGAYAYDPRRWEKLVADVEQMIRDQKSAEEVINLVRAY